MFLLIFSAAATSTFDFTVTDQCGLDTTITVTVNVPVLPEVNMDVLLGTSDSTFTEGCTDALLLFTRPDTSTGLTAYLGIGGNAINGTDYTFLADSVFFGQGVDSVSYTISAFADGITETNDTITITLFIGNNCSTQQMSFYITEPDSLTVDAGSDVSVTCPGTAVTLSGSSGGGAAPYTYQWSNSATSASTSVSPLTTTSYIFTATDACGTSISDSVTVSVPLSPPFVLSSLNENVICPGDPAILEVNFNGGGIAPYNFLWSNGDTGLVTQVAPLISTSYSFTVTDQCSKDTTIYINVNVPEYQPLEISISEMDLCITDSLTVTPYVEGGAGGNFYSWNGPAGTTFSVSQQSGTVQFSNPLNGVYYVSVTDQCGSVAADSAAYYFRDCSLLIPNVISPNGDGSNDSWVILNLEYHPQTQVQIFNRWGQLIYESPDYNNTWNGDDVPDGTYFYVVRPVNGDGPFTGTLTVFKK